MDRLSPRLNREFKTIERMIGLYCRKVHGRARSEGLCEECDGLRKYARNRLEHCVYQEEKPACSKCPVHCYAPHRREQAREVMRFSGPRMLFHHPILAILHQLDNRREAPEPPEASARPDRKRKDPESHSG